MTSKRYLGNIITDTPTEPSDNFETTSANGVWSLAEALSYVKAGVWPTAGNVVPIGLFSGGGSRRTVIDKIVITTTGNATDFGDLNQRLEEAAGFSSTTKSFTSGGYFNGLLNNIQTVNFATAGNATDYGDLTVARNSCAGTSNTTRGLTFGGDSFSSKNTIDFITMASSGNASDFGDMTRSCYRLGAAANSTRAVSFGGTNTNNNIIDYVTIASTGNATDFGDLTANNDGMGGTSSGNTAFSLGGNSSGKYKWEYFNITTTGNATSSSDASAEHLIGMGAVADSNKAVIAGADNTLINTTISYVTVSSKAGWSDFGDLSVGGFGIAGSCNSHGGLQ